MPQMKLGIWNMELEKGNTGHSPYMKSGIWDHENYPILEYGKREIMKLGTWNKVILKFELGNIPLPLGSPCYKHLVATVLRVKCQRPALFPAFSASYIIIAYKQQHVVTSWAGIPMMPIIMRECFTPYIQSNDHREQWTQLLFSTI